MKVAETVVLPTGLTPDGKWVSAPINLSYKTNKELLDLIRGYGLKPKFRRNESYKKCLAEFSDDRDSWDTLRRPPPNMHKGTRRHHNGTNLASPLKNPLTAAQHAAHSGYASLDNPTPVDTREGKKLAAWAVKFSEDEAGRQNQATIGSPVAISRTPPAQDSSTSSSPKSQFLPSTKSSGDVSLETIASDLLRLHNTTQNLLDVALSGQLVSLGLKTAIPAGQDHRSLQGVGASSEPHRTPENLVTLSMKTQTITILSTDIPDPPPLHFRGNVEFINAIWDDSPETWNHSSPLLINGISIPLEYWRTLYAYRRSKQWSGLKQRWSDYKLLVQEFRGLGKINFWVKYSVNGDAMSMSTILKSLRKARRRVNDATAENARRAFGENFSRIFCYKKHRITSVIQNDRAIARRYHTLQHDINDSV